VFRVKKRFVELKIPIYWRYVAYRDVAARDRRVQAKWEKLFHGLPRSAGFLTATNALAARSSLFFALERFCHFSHNSFVFLALRFTSGMTILDRYLLRSFFFNLIMWLFCVVGMFVVFDLVSNFDALLKTGKEAGSVWKLLLTYYTFKSVPVVMMLGSLIGLLSAMVTVAMLMRQNELVPIQAAGVSTFRIALPLLIAFFLFVTGLTVVRECVLPQYLDELTADYIGVAGQKGQIVNATVDYETGIHFNGDHLFKKDKRITNPNFLISKPIVKRGLNIKAESAVYREAVGNNPAGFMLVNVKEPKEFPGGESLTFEEQPVVITSKDAPEWIQPKDCFVATKIPFAYFASSESWNQYASIGEMIAATRNPSMDLGRRTHGAIHARLLMPFLDAAVIFLGLPVILVRGGRNVFKAMGVSALILLAFIFVREGSQYLGPALDRPALGAWLPMMLFGPIAVNQFLTLRNC